ncbi:MAG TPA: hypothetical protein VGS80_07665 [Ktedonobacterales bacterium]|nr:hypothetical protein [Ktedonobacterales bacterium]
MSDEAGGTPAFDASEITGSVGELPGVGGLGAGFEGGGAVRPAAAMFALCLIPLALLRMEKSLVQQAKRAAAGDTQPHVAGMHG